MAYFAPKVGVRPVTASCNQLLEACGALRRLVEEASSPLHVCLMSATMDSEVFSSYFGRCPRVSFPGRSYRVDTLHLEHVLALCRHVRVTSYTY